jgi:hypothetical protein
LDDFPLPEALKEQPRIALTPERELSTTIIESSADIMVIRSEWRKPTGKFYLASTVREIEIAAKEIPKADREAWIADRVCALRKEQRRTIAGRKAAGYSSIERQMNAAYAAERRTAKELCSTVPTTVGGVAALLRYAVREDTIFNDHEDLVSTAAEALAKIEGAGA